MVGRTLQPRIVHAQTGSLRARQAAAAPRGVGLGRQKVPTQTVGADVPATEAERPAAYLWVDRQILDDTGDAVLLLDSELQVIHANAFATSLLDRSDG